ncbi:RNAse III [Orbus hercynius]|uniref:Ribonuclease 3 n=2 Tax=Orbus hercynius TaxID=593135 RepID=A0A495RJZ1_9GAMM|nr:RNAse III [Orbus hercynius]
MKANEQRLEKLQQSIGYRFNDINLLSKALTHRSADKSHNERLEYLGDSILSFVIAEALFNQFPFVDEGDLSQMRSTLVCGEMLAVIGQDFGIGDCLILGQGELKSGGHRRDSIISDALEAIIGAIYLDSCINTIKQLILTWYQSRLKTIEPGIKQKDAKTRLQEYLQGIHQARPVYLIVEVIGSDHEQEFVIQCKLDNDDNRYMGRGVNRRKAEQAAAQTAIDNLGIK